MSLSEGAKKRLYTIADEPQYINYLPNNRIYQKTIGYYQELKDQGFITISKPIPADPRSPMKDLEFKLTITKKGLKQLNHLLKD